MQKAYKYGIELECLVDRDKYTNLVTSVNTSKLPFMFSGDGSVIASDGYTGLEIKCSKPLAFNTLESNTKKLCKILEDLDVTVNTTCGYHVHVSNKRFFNKKFLMKLTKFWCAIEDVLISTQPRSRHFNKYCKRKLLEYVKTGEDLPKSKELLVENLRDKNRYYSINYASLAKFGTIESRLHAGTINAKKILNWVKLMTSIYNYVLTDYDPQTVEDLFNETISDSKVAKVLEVLQVEADVKEHFKSRVQKFGFEELEKQQKAGIEALKIQPALLKARKAYEKTMSSVDTLQDRMNSALTSFEEYRY